jgi:E3 ubiquitin-protein ligase listerin
MARDLLRNTGPADLDTLLTDIFPSDDLWKASLEPFLKLPIRLSTSITSPLGGTVNLLSNELSTTAQQDPIDVQWDSVGASSAFRLATYVVKILSLPNVLASLNVEQRESLFYYLPLALQLIDDDVSIEGSVGIIGLEASEDRDEALEIVSDGRSILSQWIRSDTRFSDNTRSIQEDILALWELKAGSLNDLSPESYRIGQAYVNIVSGVDATKSSDSLTSLAREIRKYNPIRAASELAIWGPALSSSPSGTRLCNELIADATGFKPNRNLADGEKNLPLVIFREINADLI